MLAVILFFCVNALDVRATEEVIVSTFAGTGFHGADDGHAAQFNLPRGVLATPWGVYVADTFNNMIRFVSFGTASTTTVAGSILGLDVLRFPVGLYRDGAIADALFNRPAAMVMGAGNNVFVLDSANHSLRIVMQEGVFTFAGNGQPGHVDGLASQARFNRPTAMAVGPDGSIYIADSGNHVIRRADSSGIVSTVAGIPGISGHSDGDISQALFNGPMGIAVDIYGRIFVADTGNHLIRMIYDGYVTTLAGSLIFPYEIDFEITYYVNEWDNVPLGGFMDGQGDAAMFNLPQGLAIWQDTLIVADSGNHRIRAISPGGLVFTLAGNGYPGHEDGPAVASAFHLPEGLSVWGDTLYVADTGNNVIRMINLTAFLLEAAVE